MSSEVSLSRFTLFKNLPPEIRLAIWRCRLRRERIISVSVHTNDQFYPDEHEKLYSVNSNVGSTMNQIFHVTRESRYTALCFYRVRIPYQFLGFTFEPNGPLKHTLYFNPEYDFLQVEGDNYAIARFVHDMKTVYDPLKVGILNLVINELYSDHCMTQIKRQDIGKFEDAVAVIRSFTETLRQIRQVLIFNDRFDKLPKSSALVPGRFRRARMDVRNNKKDFRPAMSRLTFSKVHEWKKLLGEFLGSEYVHRADLRVLQPMTPHSSAGDNVHHKIRGRDHRGGLFDYDEVVFWLFNLDFKQGKFRLGELIDDFVLFMFEDDWEGTVNLLFYDMQDVAVFDGD
ncbi:hypothetical protein F4777DRAFT_598768 [Nemania sp. FL0916]|nr:hypothetical protein F4777DRAFT_598768 [Nemania sp. FL0916]